jgi:hypothetical protein
MQQSPFEIHKTEAIKIEVTSTETDETTMRRQALAHQGSVFMTGPVWSEGRQIMSEPKMVDVDEVRKRLLQCAFTRFQSKAEREDDPQTAILVYVNSSPSLPFWYRAQLLERTRTYLKTQRPRLYRAYCCYQADQGVGGLRNDIRELTRHLEVGRPELLKCSLAAVITAGRVLTSCWSVSTIPSTGSKLCYLWSK